MVFGWVIKKNVSGIYLYQMFTYQKKTSTESTNSLIAHLTSFHLTVKIENVDSCHVNNLDLALLISCWTNHILLHTHNDQEVEVEVFGSLVVRVTGIRF